MRLRTGFNIIKTSISDFAQDDVMTLAAALAFYALFSLAPLLIILVSILGLIEQDVHEQMIRQVETTVGPQASRMVATIIEGAAEEPMTATVSAIVGLGILIFSATIVFVQLQYSMNRIWNVRPAQGHAVWRWLRKRLLSVLMVVGLGVLILVSITLSTVLRIVFPNTGGIWGLINFSIPLLLYTILFAMIFKLLPDVKITWRGVWLGAIMTAILFSIGNYAIGLYLGYAGIGSTYGAAGSLVVLLIWVYYASLIVFYGAELTQVLAHHYGTRIVPEDYAEWTTQTGDRPHKE